MYVIIAYKTIGGKMLMYKKIEQLARHAGKIMLEAVNAESLSSEKSSNSDIVTEYDMRIQNFLVKELRILYPNAKFLGEEGESKLSADDYLNGEVFIIDPIDGTTNFVRGFFKSAVSIAYAINSEVVYGCCYIPYCDELYTAEKGKKALCNGNEINCATREIQHSIVSVGTTPYEKEKYCNATFGIMQAFYKSAMDVRRFGSAVIDLLDVACGKSDLYCELSLSPWDFAAAGFIAQTAGATVTAMNGNELRFDKRHSVLAASEKCREFFENCSEIQKYKELFN